MQDAARNAYARAVQLAPSDTDYLYALARLLEQSGDSRQALQEYERFLSLWKRADPELPELGEARRAVARLRTTSTSG